MVKKLISPYLPLPLKLVILNTINRIKYGRTIERHENPYTTHLPVLIGLSRIFQINRVLEFGSGEFSTLIFLNKEIFPNLIQLSSFENDVVWAEKITSLTKEDSRVKLNLVYSQMSEVVAQAFKSNNGKYDLIFVDDSISAEQRAATIREVSLHCNNQSLVVIHDYEIEEYQEAANGFKNRFKFDAYNPNTGLVWNTRDVKMQQLQQLNKLLTKFASKLQPDDVQSWLKLLNSEGNKKKWN